MRIESQLPTKIQICQQGGGGGKNGK